MSAKHVAIIMDGNRRWAKQRRFEILRGHSQGTSTLKAIARHAYESGVTNLTVFAFSTENWARPKAEVVGLIELMKRFLMQDLETLQADNVKLSVIGELTRFDQELQGLFDTAQSVTANNTGLHLTIAVNYGGQQDVLSAVQKLQEEGKSADTVEDVKAAMQSSFLPPVDLLIRTGGEMRVSNFLLWDIAYAELHFCEKYWPDFTADDFDKALSDFDSRERRFGGDPALDKLASEA